LKKHYVLVIFGAASFVILVNEICWGRMLSQALGATIGAVTLVLTSLMAGMGIGAGLFGLAADRSNRLNKLFGSILLGGGAGSAMAFGLIKLIPDMQRAEFPQPAIIAMTMAALMVPAAFLGGLLPVAGRLTIKQRGEIGPGIGKLYTVETASSSLGGLLTGFLFIAWFGQQNTCLAAAALLTGAGIWVIAAGPVETKDNQTAAGTGKRKRELIFTTPATGVAFINGLAGMALQIAWLRILKAYLPNTSYSFSVVSCLIIFGLFTGSFLYRKTERLINRPAEWLAGAEITIAAWIIVSAAAATSLPRFLLFPLADLLGSQVLRIFLPPLVLSLALILVPAVGFGFCFPLLCRLGSKEVGSLGGDLGRVRLANTLGSVAGPSLGAFLLIPLAGSVRTLLLASLLSLAGAAWAAFAMGPASGRRKWMIASSALAVISLVMLIAVKNPMVLPPSMLQGGSRQSRVVFYRETLEGTVIVNEDQRTGIRACYVNNSGVVGTTYDAIKAVKLLGHLPFLAGKKPKEILVVGFGIGVTTATIASHPGIRNIDCVEITPGVRQAAEFFDQYNSKVYRSGAVTFIDGDGRQYLQRTKKKYDFISADPTHPTLGCGQLYTGEYFRLCREHLNPGGVVCQYLPLHGVTEKEFRGMVGTFAREFQHASLWLGISHGILMGSDEDISIDFREWSRNIDSLDDPLFYKDAYSAAACLMLDKPAMLRLSANSPVCRDDDNYLEFFSLDAKRTVNWELNVRKLMEHRIGLSSAFSFCPDTGKLDSYLSGQRFYVEGQIMKNRGDWRKTLELYQQAVAINPSNEEYRFLMQQEMRQAGLIQ
jgi:spermidine synthase